MRASERITLMAGPLSSEEIEDVVSSVRRLVSNEQRPRNLSRDLNSERLLLTPAQRVMPDNSPLSPLLLDASLLEPRLVEVPLAAADPAPDTRPLPVDVQAAPEPAEVVTLLVVPDDAEIDLDADLPPVADPDPVADPELAADLAEATLAEPEAEWEDEIWTEPATISLGEAALAADEAEVLTGPAVEDEMPDADALDDQAEAWAGADRDSGDAAPIPFVPLRRRAEHLAARLAAGEVVETIGAEAAADVVPLSDAAPETNLPIAADADPEPVGPLPTEFVDADGMQLDVLDEHALQEIVRQTLRAELQGELGERITRNVRKLVRAEINRALMARDLD